MVTIQVGREFLFHDRGLSLDQNYFCLHSKQLSFDRLPGGEELKLGFITKHLELCFSSLDEATQSEDVWKQKKQQKKEGKDRKIGSVLLSRKNRFCIF